MPNKDGFSILIGYWDVNERGGENHPSFYSWTVRK